MSYGFNLPATAWGRLGTNGTFTILLHHFHFIIISVHAVDVALMLILHFVVLVVVVVCN